MPEAQVEAKDRADLSGPVPEAQGPAASSGANGGIRSHERSILRLQETAGNRATARLVAGRDRVQRAPNDGVAATPASGAPFAPKPFYEGFDSNADPLTTSIMSRPAAGPAAAPPPPPPLEPPRPAHGRKRDGITALTGGTDLGPAPIGDRPAGEMSYTQTLDEIAALEGWLSKRQQSNAETIPAEDRLTELYQRIATLLGARRKGKRPAGRRPKKPRSLTEKLDILHMTRDEMAVELDAIVEYLAGTPKRDEVRKLADVGTYLDERLATARAEDTERVRQTDIGLALNVNYPNVISQLEEVIRRIEQIRPDPASKELARLPSGRASIPVLKAEAEALRNSAKRQVSEYIGAVEELVENAHTAYKARVERNEDHPRVHYLVRVYTGVDDLDPNVMAVEYSTLHSDAAAARRELSRGRLLRAVHRATGFAARTDGYANKIGDWEGSLMRGAGRWVLALTVLKTGLELLATGGAAAFTAAKVARGASALRTALTLGGTLGSTGFGVGFGGSLYSQSTMGQPISGWKAARVGGKIGVDSALIGLTPGIGTTAKNLMGVGEGVVGLSRTSRYLRTGVAELGTGTLLQGGAALAKDESLKDAMIGVGIGAGISGLGGLALKDFAAGRKGIERFGGGLLGGGSNLLTGLAQGKEGSDLAITTLSGVAGGAVSQDLESTGKAYLEGRSTTTGRRLPASAAGPAGATGAGTAPAGASAPAAASAPTGATAPTAASTPMVAPLAAPGSGTVGTPTGPAAGGTEPTTAGPAGGAKGGGAPSSGGDQLPGADEVEAAFSDVSGLESGPYVQASADAPKGARVTPDGVHELDLGGISSVTTREGPAPLQPGDQPGPVQQGKAPPETWLVDPARANLTDPAAIADTDFKPNRTGFDYDVRNAQIRSGPGGASIATPSGPEFGGQRVVGGARGATLDPTTGTWQPGSPAHDRSHNPLGQDAAFQERPAADWHALEQTHGPLTDEQRYALWFYSDDLSGQINPALRGGKAQEFVTDALAVEGAASDLDRTMQPVPFDTIVHRKASVADFADLGVADPAELAGLTGKTYAHQGYTSTAVEGGHWSGDIDIVIQVPKGTRGRYLGGPSAKAQATNPLKPAAGAAKASMPGEMEFLIERGTSFTIQKAEVDSSGRWRVEVRVAEQGIKPKPLSNPVPLPGTGGPGGGGGSSPTGNGGGSGRPRTPTTPGTFPPRAPGPDTTTQGTFPPRAPGPDTTTPGTFPPRAPGPDTTTPGTFPPRAPGPDSTTKGTFPPRLPGPNPVRDAEVSLGLAVVDRHSAEDAAKTALAAATGGDAQAGLAYAKAVLVLAERKVDEARAAVAVLEARVAVATKAGNVDSRLTLQLEVAKSDVGYRLFDLGQARNQVVRATRVAEGVAHAAAAHAARSTAKAR